MLFSPAVNDDAVTPSESRDPSSMQSRVKRGRGQPLPGIYPTWVFGTGSGFLKAMVVVNSQRVNYLELTDSVTAMRLVLATPEAKLPGWIGTAGSETEDS
jgi:hypothetical protein